MHKALEQQLAGCAGAADQAEAAEHDLVTALRTAAAVWGCGEERPPTSWLACICAEIESIREQLDTQEA